MRHLDLFSGIGGFALAARNVWGNDHEVIAFCEIDKYCQKVLNKHWPGVPIYEDVRELDGETITNAEISRKLKRQEKRVDGEILSEAGRVESKHNIDALRPERIDLIAGGFPCQPFSTAGLRRGTEDDRHLWPEMYRIIKEVQPRWIVGENVYGFLDWNDGLVFDQSCADLETAGYEVWAYVLPACGVGAPHRRDRVWIVAYRRYPKQQGRGETSADHDRCSREGEQSRREPASCREDVADSERDHVERDRPAREQKPEIRQQDNTPQGGRQAIRVRSDRPTESRLGRGFNGLPDWLDGSWERGVPRVTERKEGRKDRLKGLGNAIVPQVAEQIFRAIKAYNEAN